MNDRSNHVDCIITHNVTDESHCITWEIRLLPFLFYFTKENISWICHRVSRMMKSNKIIMLEYFYVLMYYSPQFRIDIDTYIYIHFVCAYIYDSYNICFFIWSSTIIYECKKVNVLSKKKISCDYYPL